MTTMGIDYCAGYCKSAAHYIIYPYSYNIGDVYNDTYYLRIESWSGDVTFLRVSRTGNNNRYRTEEITENDYISPVSSEFYYSDTGSDYVGLPVSRYVHTYGIDLFGCVLIGAVLTAFLGGVFKWLK